MEKHGVFEADLGSFLEGFLMADEVWVYYYQPNMKDQYYQWKKPRLFSAKETNDCEVGGLIVFWDTQWVLLVGFSELGPFITRTY